MITYDAFRSKVKGFLLDDSAELDADLDTLIRLAELRIYREADLRLFKRHAFTALTAGDYWLTLPPDCIVVRDVRISGGDFLHSIPETFIREYWPDPAVLGTPKYYGQWDAATLMLAPTPANSAQIELTYTYQPPGLSADNPSTWLSTHAEDLLLYAVLTEASTYKQGMIPAEAAAKYAQGYQAALARVAGQEQLNRIDEYKQRGLV